MVIQAGFFYFAAVIIFCALMVVTRKNPVHSVLFMLPLFFHVAGIFIMLDAEFVAAIQVLVYAGAIMVLFLFVIMLFNVHNLREAKAFTGNWPIVVPMVLTLGGLIMSVLTRSAFNGTQGPDTVDVIKQAGNSQLIGKALFGQFLLPFEVASIILLVAMVGAIVLAKKKID